MSKFKKNLRPRLSFAIVNHKIIDWNVEFDSDAPSFISTKLFSSSNELKEILNYIPLKDSLQENCSKQSGKCAMKLACPCLRRRPHVYNQFSADWPRLNEYLTSHAQYIIESFNIDTRLLPFQSIVMIVAFYILDKLQPCNHDDIIKSIFISCIMEYHSRLIQHMKYIKSKTRNNDFASLSELCDILMAMLLSYYMQFAPDTFIDTKGKHCAVFQDNQAITSNFQRCIIDSCVHDKQSNQRITYLSSKFCNNFDIISFLGCKHQQLQLGHILSSRYFTSPTERYSMKQFDEDTFTFDTSRVRKRMYQEKKFNQIEAMFTPDNKPMLDKSMNKGIHYIAIRILDRYINLRHCALATKYASSSAMYSIIAGVLCRMQLNSGYQPYAEW